LQRKFTKKQQNHKIKLLKMKEILKQVSVTDEKLFKEAALKRLGWSRDQYNNRVQGRTRLTSAERAILLNVAEEIKTQVTHVN
jgi:hypothetical protein